MRRLWPGSLIGQVLLTLALALLLAQAISTVLLLRQQDEHRQEAVIHTAAFRLLVAARHPGDAAPRPEDRPPSEDRPSPAPFDIIDHVHAERVASFAPLAGDTRLPQAEQELGQILAEQDIAVGRLIVVDREPEADRQAKIDVDAPLARKWNHDALLAPKPEDFPGSSAAKETASAKAQDAAQKARHFELLRHRFASQPPERVLVVALQTQPGGSWLVARAYMLPRNTHLLVSLIGQTVLIYLVLVIAIALILRRITRPLAALTNRVEQFADTRAPEGRLEPAGPTDVRRLIAAQGAMEHRIVALLEEKNVMLGAIGHDLKTPLAALRVRIESVEDEGERARMAATIEDIVRSLDDILSLARVGRPSDPLEMTELSALVDAVVEEYEDMGEAVSLGDTCRIALPLRATWLRRALRNLIGNALRYGGAARVTVSREAGPHAAWAVVRIDDDGPGIPEDQIARMMEPFIRGEPSRNSETGGAGLGLTLSAAIAEQHGGTITLTNRPAGGAAGAGLTAILRLPLPH